MLKTVSRIASRAVRFSAPIAMSGFLASTALAVPVVFTSEAAWLAAVGGATVLTEDFEASPVGTLAAPATTDIGLFSVTLDGTSAFANSITDGGNVNGTRQLNGDVDDSPPGSLANVWTFDAAVIGFAGTFIDTTTADRLTVTVNGTTFNFFDFLGTPGDGFFGVVDTTPFGSISFGSENASGVADEAYHVDNVLLAQAAAVPEPVSLGLLGLGLAGLGWSRRRR